ncbi:MAG: AAA family ATPase [Planctomycetes bacterium]|nr:AAA family ATPase [Planctomycetota bacterium]
MNNFEDKIKHNANSAGESHQFRPDPIIHARDDFSRSHEGLQHTEIIRSVEDPFSLTNTALQPNQFMGTGGPSQSLPPATDILKTMYRFKWMILAIFILVATPAIAAIWTQVVPEYQAKAQLRIRPIIPHLVFRTEDNGMIPLYESFVNTQVSIMKSSTVLQRVLEQQKVQETQFHKTPKPSLKQRLLGNPVPPSMERLQSSLTVRPRRGTEIMEVSFVDTSPKDAKIIVDAVLEEYRKYIGEKSDADKDFLYDKLVEQHKSLENEIKGREVIIAQFRSSLGTGTPHELISNMRLRLEDTQASLSKLRQSIAVLDWELKQAITNDSNDVPVASTVEMNKQKVYYEDVEWRRLDIAVRTNQHKIATSLFTRKHPDMALAEKDLKFSEELLRLREAQLDEQWRDEQKNKMSAVPIITNASNSGNEEVETSLEFQLNRARQEELLLVAELNRQKKDFQASFTDAQSLETENSVLQHKRDLFKAVQQRLDAKNMESNVRGSIEVLAGAFAPSMPYQDRRIMLTGMALFLCLCMGGGAAYLKATITQTIYTHKDIPYPMQVPFLGYVPANRTKKSSDKESSPAMIESIRVVRTALLSRLNSQGNATVLVTSADAATGKSTFTMMLGKSLALVGKKVLIIDADFRKITLTKRFNLPGKSGFLESLSSRSVDKRHIFPTETFGLSIMPAGKRTNNGMVFEETANGAFKTCIGQLRKQFNIILLDSSPILPVADAAILSSQVDGTIMVERELVSRRANVINALARLGSAGGRILGTVFVGSNSNEGYGYDYSYSRTSES